jgi:hypothetical protein
MHSGGPRQLGSAILFGPRLGGCSLPEKAKLEKKTFFGERQQQAQHTIASRSKQQFPNACTYKSRYIPADPLQPT